MAKANEIAPVVTAIIFDRSISAPFCMVPILRALAASLAFEWNFFSKAKHRKLKTLVF